MAMNDRDKRCIIEYIAIGSGLLLTSIRCYINWKLESAERNEIIGNLSLVILAIAGIIIALMSCIHHIDIKLQSKLKSCKKELWETRQGTDLGLAIIPLFPSSLLFGLLSHYARTNYIYTVTSVNGLGFLISSVVLLWKCSSKKILYPSWNFYRILLIGNTFVIVLILGQICSLSYVIIGLLTLASQSIFLILWNEIAKKCSYSFSMGELVTVVQAATALYTACMLWFLSKFFEIYPSNYPKSFGEETTQFSLILAIGCGSLILIPTVFNFARQAVPFYAIGGLLGAGVMYPSWYAVFQRDPVLWALDFVLQTGPKIYMIFHWVTCSVLALAIVVYYNFRQQPVTTIVRKYFHIIVIMVYLPALAWEPELLFLASSIAFGVFVVLELIRALCVPPFGPVLQMCLQIFLDEKDTGKLILTHVYLLFGSSVSLWLLPLDFRKAGFHIASMSGILSLGFGDTAASVGGTWWGKDKWPDSKKSLQGTFCAIVVQSFVSLILLWITQSSWFWFAINGVHVVIATCLCSVLEGVTTQVDNLILPIFLYTTLVVL